MKNKGTTISSRFKNLFKLIFSRTALVLLFLLLQLVVLVLGINYLYNLYWISLIISSALSLIAVVHLVNRDMLMDLKISWFLTMIFVPIVGSVCYFLFSGTRAYRRARRRYKYIRINALKYKSEKLCEDNQVKFIQKQTGFDSFDGSNVTYYSSGESFLDSLCESLNQAKEFIFMEYFILKKGVMWERIHQILKQKVSQGVEVRLMIDGLCTMKDLPFNFARKLKKEGIIVKQFNKVVAQLTASQNNRDHRKITIIDGKVGFMGSSNIADEYINHIQPYHHWKDANIKIEGLAVKSLILMFNEMYEMHSKKDFSIEKYISKVESVESNGFVVPYGSGPKVLFGDYISENIYLDIINQAQKSLYIMTPYFIVTQELFVAIKNASLRGVDVRIVIPHVPDKKIIFLQTKNMCNQLIKHGVKVYRYTPGFIHSKVVLCDDVSAIVGTVNFDYRSLVHHFECGVWLKNCDAIKDVKQDFVSTFNQSALQEKIKMNIISKFFASLLSLFAPLL